MLFPGKTFIISFFLFKGKTTVAKYKIQPTTFQYLFLMSFSLEQFRACVLQRKYLACREKGKFELRYIMKDSEVLGNIDMVKCMWE